MVSIINSWAQGIILAVIVASINEIILPEGNNKKYVKTIIGIYILFVMVDPLVSKISNRDINIDSIIKNTESKMNEYKSEELTLETNAYIEETYKQKLEDDIKQKSEEKGYKINSLKLTIETEKQEQYGEINAIVMRISKIEDEQEIDKNITKNTVNKIQNVEINISNDTNTNEKNEEKLENVSVEEIEDFKKYLNTLYGTQKENIHINELE